MDRFTVEVITQTPNPQQTIYAAMHQDYAEGFVWDERDRWPSEAKCGDLIVKNLLAGNRGHYGPLEHPQIILNCGWFPHSTMQQIRTHRVGISFDVQCLAGDTEVTFVHVSGSLQTIKIADLYDCWVNGESAPHQGKIRGCKGEPPEHYHHHYHHRHCRASLQTMHLRVLNEETGCFETSHIRDVMCSGLQPIYRLTFEDGKTLDCTTNHRLLTTDGWQPMGDAVGLETRPDDGVVTMTRQCAVLAMVFTNGVVTTGEGIDWDQAWLQRQIELELSTHEIMALAARSEATTEPVNQQRSILPSRHLGTNGHSRLVATPQPQARPLRPHPLRVIQVDYLGVQMTYDLEVAGDWHNFVANGLVVHNSFRYTGQRIIDVIEGKRELEEVFYLRPLGFYTDRQGKKYAYTAEQRQQDLEWCLQACQRYKQRIDQGFSEEHARGLIPFDVRQHWVMSANVRSLMHLLDLRWKGDAQLEAQQLCEAIWPHFKAWVPAIAAWYEANRMKKARLAP